MIKKENFKNSLFDKSTQIFLPLFTIIGFMLTAFKKPELGLVFNLLSQVFWLYAGWKAWRNAGQIGIFITAVVITVFLVYGVVNYWFL